MNSILAISGLCLCSVIHLTVSAPAPNSLLGGLGLPAPYSHDVLDAETLVHKGQNQNLTMILEYLPHNVPLDKYAVPLDKYAVPLDKYVVPLDKVPLDKYAVPLDTPRFAVPNTPEYPVTVPEIVRPGPITENIQIFEYPTITQNIKYTEPLTNAVQEPTATIPELNKVDTVVQGVTNSESPGSTLNIIEYPKGVVEVAGNSNTAPLSGSITPIVYQSVVNDGTPLVSDAGAKYAPVITSLPPVSQIGYNAIDGGVDGSNNVQGRFASELLHPIDRAVRPDIHHDVEHNYNECKLRV
jgi:hypothetical protein